MEYTVVRSRRKTLSIVIDREGEVEVRAPLRASKAEIERFVEKSAGWIAEKTSLARARAARRREFRLEIGSRVLYLGRECPIEAGEHAAFHGGVFMVDPDRELKPQIVALYRELARPWMAERVELFAGRIGAAPAGLRITGAASRWGSCSGKNTLCFSWRLMMAEPELIDYVAVHELCHILHHDHSPRFWAAVASVLPDYREREARLRDLGRLLREQDWES